MPSASILVVDDAEDNRGTLRRALVGSGHRILEAQSGAEALSVAESESIDLAVVDFVMPGIDGIETGRRLKQAAAPQFFPVVLVTAVDERALRARGLGVVDDFVARPFDTAELRARTNNLLRLRQRDNAFRQQAIEMKELLQFRDEMFSLVVHDLKSPLSVIVANMAYAEQSLTDEDARAALHEGQLAAKRQLRLIANLLDLSRLETARLTAKRQRTTIGTIVRVPVDERRFVADLRGITLQIEGQLDDLFAVDADLLGRVLENLLDNAMRYAPRGGRIVVAVRLNGDGLVITVGNSGPPIPADCRAQVFEKFAQANSAVGRMNMGLGLYFCRLAVTAHGGKLSVEESKDLPTVFCIRIPNQK